MSPSGSRTPARAAEVFRVLAPQAGTIRVELATPARPRLVFLPLFYADPKGGLVSLASGQELAAVIPIFYGGFKWTFRTRAPTSSPRATGAEGHRPRERCDRIRSRYPSTPETEPGAS
jgi:hypothetical protein